MAVSASASPLIRGDALDYYLAQGYYRMHQDLFTCQFVPFGNRLYSAHWLRLDMARVQWGPEQRHLLRRNARFAATVRPLRLTAEHEELYARYRESITFEAAPTVTDVLLGDAAQSVFDRGDRTLAGILNFYDPNYRKFSLGKYLLLLKTDYGRRLQYTHYYPGYVVHDYPKFDYKLFACAAATEVFDCVRGQWQPFSSAAVAAQSAELFADWLPENLQGVIL